MAETGKPGNNLTTVSPSLKTGLIAMAPIPVLSVAQGGLCSTIGETLS